MRMYLPVLAVLVWLMCPASPFAEEPTSESGGQQGENSCVACHRSVTPGIVRDWELSAHSRNFVACDMCHGDDHKSATDTDQAGLATPEVCAQCHPERVEQFTLGKHSQAWTSMVTMPTTHWQPMDLLQGLKGCSGCHRIGLKSDKALRELRKSGSNYGAASCDGCHTRHLFSRKEASQPQACRTCHMGIDHPQWEMYSSSKHGVRYMLKQSGVLPAEAAAPTCQTCHMPEGHHGVRAAWGFFAVRLPMPEGDKEWTANRTTVMKGLGLFSPDGKPTPRLEAFKGVDAMRLDQESWQAGRSRMLNVCTSCHARSFAENELGKSDKMIREADRIMAQGLESVAELYRRGVLQKPKGYPFAYPDLLTFHDAPTAVEQELFMMFLEHRMRTFQGSFHANPDYALWYGWSAMLRDLTSIRERTEAMLKAAASEKRR